MSRTQQILRLAWLGLLGACGCLSAPAPSALAGEGAEPAVAVKAEYPGASAQLVADNVAAPIEQQVNRVEKMRWMRSRSASDGSYTLIVGFQSGTDLDMAQVLVQSRVALALPVLPDAVKGQGVSVKKNPAGVLAIVTLFSPDGRYDSAYLSNYATINLRDELARLPGVGDVRMLGQRDYGLWVRLDAAKMSAHNLTASDVANAIGGQKAGGDRQNVVGVFPEAFADLILKTDAQGGVVRLKDVARLESGAGPERSQVVRQGKPAVALVIHALYQTSPRGLSDAVRGKSREPGPRTLRDALQKKLSELMPRLPEGLALEIAFDFTANLETPDRPTTPEYLLVDLALPAADSTRRTLEVLERCEALLRKAAAVQDVLALSENPLDGFGGRACALIRLAPAGAGRATREQIARTIRTELAKVKGITLGVRDLARPGCFPRCRYPVDLAIEDRGLEPDRVKESARRLAERLRKSGKLIDVWASSESPGLPQYEIDLDRKALAQHGVSVSETVNAVQLSSGGLRIGEYSSFGRTFPIMLQLDGQPRDELNSLKRIEVPDNQGAMVPLARLAKVRIVKQPPALDRLNMYPMLEITANPAPGETLAAVRAVCETAAADLPPGCVLTWLEELPAPR